MKLTGWGKYPQIESLEVAPLTVSDLKKILTSEPEFLGIARGMGRSYGDSSLASRTISTLSLNHIINFEESTGTVQCGAGVTLEDLLNVFVPKGWFLFVSPGTKFISVGGAIASDIHGKNHHLEGSFCDYVASFRIMLANGEIIDCSRNNQVDLFNATCGGLGLTGIVLDATFRLKPIKSAYIRETTFKSGSLEETFSLFEEHANATYSVAWVDCLATGANLGRSLIMLGEHSVEGRLETVSPQSFSIPIDLPGFFLNKYSINLFNALYYHQLVKKTRTRWVHYDSYFYPLDKIHHWNRIYGKRGFVQYQFVLPKEGGREGMTQILKKIAQSKKGSFLAVLKAFGKGNEDTLLFPMKGYTLALDFKINNELFKLLNELDEVILDYGGRIYLSKDARMTEETFKKSYPGWKQFRRIREKFGADKVFNSLQSNRLGI